MRSIFIIPCLLIVVGCSTHTHCNQELFQSSFCGATDAVIALNMLDRGELPRTHDYLTGSLALRLYELHQLSKDADKDDLERQVNLAHLVLKHITEHREQFIQDTRSLQMVIVLKSIVTNKADIQCATALTNYLATTSTNQILWPTP